MDIVRFAVMTVLLGAGVAHGAGLLMLRLRVDELAQQGLLKKGGLTFFSRNYFVMLRSIDEVMQRTDLAPDRPLRSWARLATNSFYVGIAAGVVAIFLQVIS